jgi:inner membrane protein
MASLGHVAVGMCAGRAFADRGARRPRFAIAFFAGLALLPDLDYLLVALGGRNEGAFGHRGAAHSLIPPLAAALVALALAARLQIPRWRLAWFCGLVVASHALLDAMTTGSRGVPLLWPLSFHRFEMPWRPIPNAPCGLAYVSRLGLRVAATEFLQFLPFLWFATRPPLVGPRFGAPDPVSKAQSRAAAPPRGHLSTSTSG